MPPCFFRWYAQCCNSTPISVIKKSSFHTGAQRTCKPCSSGAKPAFGGSSDPDKKFVTNMKMNVTRQERPDGVMTDIFEVVDKNKGNNVGRDEQIAQMLLTRGLVRGRRATAKSKVMPLEDGQKREALIQVRMEQRHRQHGDVAGKVGAPLLNEWVRDVCVLVLWGVGSA